MLADGLEALVTDKEEGSIRPLYPGKRTGPPGASKTGFDAQRLRYDPVDRWRICVGSIECIVAQVVPKAA